MNTAYVRNRFLSDDIGAYVAAHTSAPDDLQVALRQRTTSELPNYAGMQIGDDQFVFMELLVRSIGAHHAVEIGTFTGCSSIAIARGLGPQGRLLCCDISEEWTNIAREYWRKAGVEDRIELRLAPASTTIASLAPSTEFDFAFIDADKTGYLDYYEALLPLMRKGGLLLADNALQGGGVVDAANHSENVVAIRSFNDRVSNDDRVTSVLLALGDGVTMIQKN